MESALQFLLVNGSLTPDDAVSLVDQWPELFAALTNGTSGPCSEVWSDTEGTDGPLESYRAWHAGDPEQLQLGLLYLLGLRQVNNTSSVLQAANRLAFGRKDERFASSNSSHWLSLNYSGPLFYLVAVLLTALSIWTAIGSLLVDLSILRFRSLRTVPNILVGNLSLSDFLLAITILPMSVANDLLGHWIFGRWLCYVWLVGDVLYCTSSIWSLCVIAFDRFTATVFPIWYRDQRSPQRAILYIIADWVLSVIIIIPPMTGWMKLSDCYLEDNDHPGMMQCRLFTDEAYVVYSSMGSFIVPLLVMCVLYGKIFAVLWNRAKISKRESMMRTKQAASMTVAPVVAFSGQIKCKQTKDAEMTQTNASIQATVTINQPSVESSKRMPAISETQVLRIKVDNTVQIATISSHCTRSQLDCSVEQKESETTSKVCEMADASRRMGRKISFQTSWNRLRRKSSASQADSDSNDVLEETETTMSSRPCGRSHRDKQWRSQRRKQMLRAKSLHRRETQATLRAMLIIIIFVLCWMPFTVMYVVGGFMKEDLYINPHATRFIIWLGYANSAINPLLIFCYNQDFRAAFKAIAYGIFCGLVRRGIKTRNSVSRFEQYRRQRRKGAVCDA